MMDEKNIKLLIHGIDTLQCAYYCRPRLKDGIDYRRLNEQKEEIRQSKRKKPLAISLGNREFFFSRMEQRQVTR
jgi:hypothetical protein